MMPQVKTKSLATSIIAAVLATTPVLAETDHAPVIAPEPAPVHKAAVAATADHATPAEPHGAPHWDYVGAEGPEFWGSLSEDFELCRAGVEQSPINLTHMGATGGDPVQVFWNPTADWTVSNNGHTIQASTDNGGLMTVDGEDFSLLQFHFHTPSEHAIDGRRAPMEVHFVHKSASGALAVLGVMIEGGGSNNLFDAVMTAAPRVTGEQPTGTRNPADLLPTEQAFFRYQGSLTTPPCSETVLWTVFSEPVQVSDAQIEAFKNLYAMNARPLQPVHRRYVLAD